MQVAVDMFQARQERGFEGLTQAELARIAPDIDPKLLTGRSLLNRTTDGVWKFSHRSIMEFLVVLSGKSVVLPTSQMVRFLLCLTKRAFPNLDVDVPMIEAERLSWLSTREEVTSEETRGRILKAIGIPPYHVPDRVVDIRRLRLWPDFGLVEIPWCFLMLLHDDAFGGVDFLAKGVGILLKTSDAREDATRLMDRIQEHIRCESLSSNNMSLCVSLEDLLGRFREIVCDMLDLPSPRDSWPYQRFGA